MKFASKLLVIFFSNFIAMSLSATPFSEELNMLLILERINKADSKNISISDHSVELVEKINNDSTPNSVFELGCDRKNNIKYPCSLYIYYVDTNKEERSRYFDCNNSKKIIAALLKKAEENQVKNK